MCVVSECQVDIQPVSGLGWGGGGWWYDVTGVGGRGEGVLLFILTGQEGHRAGEKAPAQSFNHVIQLANQHSVNNLVCMNGPGWGGFPPEEWLSLIANF